MTRCQYSIGASPNTQTVTGDLSWNANGTLRQLDITDQLNSANTQACTYGYDDLVRIASANCGSAWAQTFGYDRFGNITKNGNASFNLLYDTTKNRKNDAPVLCTPYLRFHQLRERSSARVFTGRMIHRRSPQTNWDWPTSRFCSSGDFSL